MWEAWTAGSGQRSAMKALGGAGGGRAEEESKGGSQRVIGGMQLALPTWVVCKLDDVCVCSSTLHSLTHQRGLGGVPRGILR